MKPRFFYFLLRSYMPVCFNFTCDLVILFYSEINLLLFFYNYMLFDMKIKRVDSIFSETQIFLVCVKFTCQFVLKLHASLFLTYM